MQDTLKTLEEEIIADYFCTARCKSCHYFSINITQANCNLGNNPPEQCAILTEQLNLLP